MDSTVKFLTFFDHFCPKNYQKSRYYDVKTIFLKIVFTRTLRDLMDKKALKIRENSKKDRENIGTVGIASDGFYYKMESGELVRS